MPEPSSIKNQVVKGSAFIFGSSVVSKTVSLLTTLVLATLLTPDDFGVIGYGTLIIGSAGLFREMGLNSALIYHKTDIEEAAMTALWISTIWSVVLSGLVVLSAPLAAEFFREPRLEALLMIFPFSLIINSAGAIPISLMEKEMKFKRRTIPDLAHLTSYGLVVVFFALLDYGYWSFVIGTLTADLVQLIIAFLLRPVKMAFTVNIALAKEMFSFSKNVMGLSTIYFVIRNIDDLFIGRMMGTLSLGIYSFSYRIANLPATNISNVLGKVLFPSYMKIAHRMDELKSAFLKTFRYTSFVTIPVTVCTAIIVPHFVPLFYPKWTDAVLPIQLLAYFGGLRSIGAGFGSLFFARGLPNVLVPIALIQLFIVIVLLYPFVHFWGLVGGCISINLSQTVAFIMTLHKSNKTFSFKWCDYFDCLKHSVFTSMTALLIVLGTNALLDQTGTSDHTIFLGVILVLFPSSYIFLSLFTGEDARNIWKDIRGIV